MSGLSNDELKALAMVMDHDNTNTIPSALLVSGRGKNTKRLPVPPFCIEVSRGDKENHTVRMKLGFLGHKHDKIVIVKRLSAAKQALGR